MVASMMLESSLTARVIRNKVTVVAIAILISELYPKMRICPSNWIAQLNVTRMRKVKD